MSKVKANKRKKGEDKKYIFYFYYDCTIALNNRNKRQNNFVIAQAGKWARVGCHCRRFTSFVITSAKSLRLIRRNLEICHPSARLLPVSLPLPHEVS